MRIDHQTGRGIAASDHGPQPRLMVPLRGIGQLLERLLARGAALHMPLERIALSIGKAIVQQKLEAGRSPGNGSYDRLQLADLVANHLEDLGPVPKDKIIPCRPVVGILAESPQQCDASLRRIVLGHGVVSEVWASTRTYPDSDLDDRSITERQKKKNINSRLRFLRTGSSD